MEFFHLETTQGIGWGCLEEVTEDLWAEACVEMVTELSSLDTPLPSISISGFNPSAVYPEASPWWPRAWGWWEKG